MARWPRHQDAALALPQRLGFAARNVPARIDIASLRRPEVIVRRTEYRNLLVDEALLTRAFPWSDHGPSLQVFVLLEGALTVTAGDGSARIELSAGEAVLLSPAAASFARYDGTVMLDVEWLAPSTDAAPLRSLGRVDRTTAMSLAEAILDPVASQADVFRGAFDLLRSVGAPLSLSVEGFDGSPTDRDLRIARAIAAQMADLRTAASAISFGEAADLSPRHLQRILSDHCRRYRMNGTNWRDMRNRYRVQIAIALASVPQLSVAQIADEVGYSSPTALARAFADLGLPSPSVLRDQLAGARA